MKNKSPRLRGWSLNELLVVLVIIGILMLLALPNLMPLISKTKSIEAQSQLVHLYNLQQTYYYMHSKYTDDMSELGYEQAKTTTDGGTANYQVEIIDATPNSFRARATAVSDFNGNGVFNVWEIDKEKELREISKD